MFKNIGKKIKLIAKIEFWVGIVACLLWGIILASDTYDAGETFMVIFIAALCALGFYIMSCFLYGFGELVENTDILASEKKQIGIEKETLEKSMSNLNKLKMEGLINQENYDAKMAELKAQYSKFENKE